MNLDLLKLTLSVNHILYAGNLPYIAIHISVDYLEEQIGENHFSWFYKNQDLHTTGTSTTISSIHDIRKDIHHEFLSQLGNIQKINMTIYISPELFERLQNQQHLRVRGNTIRSFRTIHGTQANIQFVSKI
jgi:hypothetical protein